MANPQPVSPLKLALTALYLLVWPALLLLLGGDWRWRRGWIFGGWFVATCAGAIGWLYRRDPALLAERYRRPGSGGQSRRDRLVVYALQLGFLGWTALLGLDGRRFRWTPPLPLAVALAGGLLLALASLLLLRAFMDNSYLSPLVRIQRERGQQVASTGVYAIVRHPMYLGASSMFVGGPLLVGAASALAVGAALVLLLGWRIGDEEKLLAAELPGYEDYRRRVRYRLLPFVW